MITLCQLILSWSGLLIRVLDEESWVGSDLIPLNALIHLFWTVGFCYFLLGVPYCMGKLWGDVHIFSDARSCISSACLLSCSSFIHLTWKVLECTRWCLVRRWLESELSHILAWRSGEAWSILEKQWGLILVRGLHAGFHLQSGLCILVLFVILIELEIHLWGLLSLWPISRIFRFLTLDFIIFPRCENTILVFLPFLNFNLWHICILEGPQFRIFPCVNSQWMVAGTNLADL